MGAFDADFVPNAESTKWRTALIVVWGIDIALLIVGIILSGFNIATFIITALLLFFYFWNWKTLNVVGTAFGIVFKTLGFLVDAVLLYLSVAAYSLIDAFKPEEGTPNYEENEAAYESAKSGALFAVIVLALYVTYYFVSIFIFVKAYNAFKENPKSAKTDH